MAEKKAFWNIPYPEMIMSMLRKMLPEWKETKDRSPRDTRRLLVGLAVAALVLIWVLEGFANPLEYLVDMPALDLLDAVASYPRPYGNYYYLWLLGITTLMMSILKRLVCGEDEFPVWTVNGVLYWAVGLAVAILADALTRNVIMDRLMIPGLENMTASFTSAQYAVLMLFLVHFLFYFAIEDFSGNCMAALLTPYAIAAYNKVVAPTGLMDIQLVKFLIITLVLKLILVVLEKLGITQLVSRALIRSFYTLAGVPKMILTVIALPILPYIILWRLIRGRKKDNATQKG